MARNKKGAVNRQSILTFVDECAIQLTSNRCRTWSPVGVTPVIRHGPLRDKVSVIGGLCWNTGTGETDVQIGCYPKQNIDYQKSITFINTLHAVYPDHHITIVWDNIAFHRTTEMFEFATDNADWLSIVRLPSYAPDLNPIETLWSSWKRTYLANLCLDKVDEVRDILEQNQDQLCDHDLLCGCLVASGIVSRKELNSS